MMRPVAVSVVVPIHNGRHVVEAALRSVADQTFKDFEVIVVDDGSTDGLVISREEFPNLEIRLLRHPENRGAAAARNTGIANSKGRWIAFLDCDDSWDPHKLERQIAVIERAGRPLLACCTGFTLERNGRVHATFVPPAREAFRDEILLGCRVSPGTTLLVDRLAFDEIGGFDESFRRLEDWDWLLRYAERFDMEFVPPPLARVNLHPANVSPPASDGDPVLAAISRLGSKHREAISSRGSTAMRRFRSALLIEKGSRHYHLGRPCHAAACVAAALALHPARPPRFFGSLARAVFARLVSIALQRAAPSPK
jgi:glycosyltransferase involved in cell wall biosynthesis